MGSVINRRRFITGTMASAAGIGAVSSKLLGGIGESEKSVDTAAREKGKR